MLCISLDEVYNGQGAPGTRMALFAHLGQVEALDPGPEGDLSSVEVDDVVVAAGDGGVLQQLAAGNLSINHLNRAAVGSG